MPIQSNHITHTDRQTKIHADRGRGIGGEQVKERERKSFVHIRIKCKCTHATMTKVNGKSKRSRCLVEFQKLIGLHSFSV